MFSFIGCEDSAGLNITVKNDTESEIILITLSEKIKSVPPIQISQHSQIVLNSDIFGDIDFTISYKEREYTGNTGYADDYRSYTIRFSENSENKIECSFIANGTQRSIDLYESE
jgi:hypothetical protein